MSDGNQLPPAGETACSTYFAKRLIQQGGAGGFACRSNGHNQRSASKMNKFPKTVNRHPTLATLGQPELRAELFGIVKLTSKTRSRPEACPSIPVGNYPLSPRIRILPAPGEFYGKAASFALLSTSFRTIDSLLGRRGEST